MFHANERRCLFTVALPITHAIHILNHIRVNVVLHANKSHIRQQITIHAAKSMQAHSPKNGPRRSARQRNVFTSAGMPALFCSQHAQWHFYVEIHGRLKLTYLRLNKAI